MKSLFEKKQNKIRDYEIKNKIEFSFEQELEKAMNKFSDKEKYWIVWPDLILERLDEHGERI